MSCEKFEKFIVSSLTGETTADDEEKLKKHLARCKKCDKTFLKYKKLLATAKKIEGPVFGDAFWSARLKEVKAGRQVSKRTFLKPALLSASALLLFALLFTRGFHPADNGIVQQFFQPGNDIAVLEKLPYPEETLIGMIDLIDDDSAEQLLDILFENNFLAYHP